MKGTRYVSASLKNNDSLNECNYVYIRVCTPLCIQFILHKFCDKTICVWEIKNYIDYLT